MLGDDDDDDDDGHRNGVLEVVKEEGRGGKREGKRKNSKLEWRLGEWREEREERESKKVVVVVLFYYYLGR